MCERLGGVRSDDLILPASRGIQRGGPSLCTPRGAIQRRERLGGLLHEYYRAAA
jgi:hypothetical protein